MHWLDDAANPDADSEVPSSRRGPPQLPGLPNIPPMPVLSTDGPAPTNKTIEVEPQWLELVEERRAQNAKAAAAAAAKAAPRARPIIPREEE